MRESTRVSIPGFKAASASAGIKKGSQHDLAIFFSEHPTVSTAVFTKNLVQAAPILWAKKNGSLKSLRGVLVNSGNANACTGDEGMSGVEAVARAISKRLHLKYGEILVSSTGVIGVPLPQDRIITTLDTLLPRLGEDRFPEAARAIMTTDRFEKIHSETFRAGGKVITVFGIAKGAGMISPDMGTTLAYIFTDCYLPFSKLERIFKESIDTTFNRIIVDGDTSTNDTAVLFANGATLKRSLLPEEQGRFEHALLKVLKDLAFKVVSDGEGSTRVVKIRVTGAKSRDMAEKVAKTIGTSMLVKTAIYGADLNWGRVVAAAGRAGVPVNPGRMEVYVDGIRILGASMQQSKRGIKRAKERAKKEYYEITLALGRGRGEYFVYTSDLTHDYVSVNSQYTT